MRRGTLPSRLAALFLFAALVVLSGYLIVGPVLDAYDRQNSAIEVAQDQLARFGERRRNLDELEAQLTKIKRAPILKKIFLMQPSKSLASAALMGRTKRVVERHGGLLVRTSVIGRKAAVTDGEMTGVTVRARMRVSPEALLKIFYELESGDKALLVDNVKIISRPQKSKNVIRNSRLASESWDILVLDVHCDITGYMRQAEF